MQQCQPRETEAGNNAAFNDHLSTGSYYAIDWPCCFRRNLKKLWYTEKREIDSFRFEISGAEQLSGLTNLCLAIESHARNFLERFIVYIAVFSFFLHLYNL